MNPHTSSLFVRIIVFVYVWLCLTSSSSTEDEKDKYRISAYDCSNKNTNIKTVSILDIANCNLDKDKVEVTKSYIQLLQLNDFAHTKVIQCKIEVSREAYHCGMFDHITIVKNGKADFLREISRDLCEKMHNDLQLTYENAVIQGLKMNDTITRSLTFAGKNGNDGKCKGAPYEDVAGKYDNVIVQGIMRITLNEFYARLSLDQNEIYLPSGKQCKLTDSYCIDPVNGHSFWDSIPKNECGDWEEKYSILFQGEAEKAEESINNKTEVVYSFNSKYLTFGLTTKGKIPACNRLLTKTEHPKLFIIESNDNRHYSFSKSGRDKISSDNIDLLTYTNSKFIYVEKYIKRQMQELYNDILRHRCYLERESLKNTLALANTAPDVFAYDLMKKPGYMAMLAGEVVHIMQCTHVPVTIDSEEKRCYEELPVFKGKEKYYLTPRTHILKTRGTLINCNKVVPSFFNVGNEWIRVSDGITLSGENPTSIQPLTQNTWTYRNIMDLLLTGIYNYVDLNNAKNDIMYPVQRMVDIDNVFAETKGIHASIPDEKYVYKILTDKFADGLLHAMWERFFEYFLTFGTIGAAFFTGIIIIYAARIVINTGIRIYLLHQSFGMSRRLFAALFSSLTNYWLHFNEDVQEELEKRVNQRTPQILL